MLPRVSRVAQLHVRQSRNRRGPLRDGRVRPDLEGAGRHRRHRAHETAPAGTGSGEYNVFGIVGKTELTEKLLLGFTGILEATDKSKYTDDWSTVDNRMGNGMRMGVSVGSETSMRAFEGGIIIENENKDSGDGYSMYIFGLYEGRFGGGGYLIGYSNGSEEKVVDGTEYISRPNSFSTIDLQVQYELDEGMYFSGDLKKIDVKYGDYGIATEDEVKTNTHAENDIKLGLNVAF